MRLLGTTPGGTDGFMVAAFGSRTDGRRVAESADRIRRSPWLVAPSCLCGSHRPRRRDAAGWPRRTFLTTRAARASACRAGHGGCCASWALFSSSRRPRRSLSFDYFFFFVVVFGLLVIAWTLNF